MLYSTADQDPLASMSSSQKHVQVVILGASGDLNARKLVPALYHSWQRGNLSKYHSVRVIGIARRPWDEQLFQEHLEHKSPAAEEGKSDGSWAKFTELIGYCRVHLDQPADYEQMRKYLDNLHQNNEPLVRVFYLAVKPDLFLETVANIKRVGLFDDSDSLCTRVVVEKPFGHDLMSSIELNKSLGTMVTERQLYRIDHYLGKETVQNILAFRFRNAMFEPMWNQKYVELVQITVAETVGMENGRGGYYDQAGALRDIIQNHALQLLALVAMEPPASLKADDVRNEKVKVLSSLRKMEDISPNVDPETHICRAQFDTYRDDKGVAEDSETETYIAIRTYIDNWRWGGVPFILRTGKCLKERFTSIRVQYHMPPHTMFGSYDECHLRPNHINLRIQPNEGIDIAFDVKKPGSGYDMKNAALSFNYSDAFQRPSPDAYQRLLEDVIGGDQSLFIRSDEVEASWQWADSVRRYMQKTPVCNYPKQSWGPKEADKLFGECEGRWATK